MKEKKTCNKCDCFSAQCPKCMHRTYIFDKKHMELSPESLEAMEQKVLCEHCGSQNITVPEVKEWCMCKRCLNERREYVMVGRKINLPIMCDCGGDKNAR